MDYNSYNKPKGIDSEFTKESPNQKKLGEDIRKGLKEYDKGLQVETFESGKSKKTESTGECGSVQYPQGQTILNHPELLEHDY